MRRSRKKTKKSLVKQQEFNELKNKFLSLVVSHEFKTPLSGILTPTTLLSKYELTGQQEIRNKHINIKKNKVHYLNIILNDFLSIEKLKTGKIRYTPSTFKLSNVINELVFNAIIYSPKNSHIGIIISQNNSETTFKEKDTGIGIPKKNQKNIFNRYFRAEIVLLIQGIGIGLSIVKRHLDNLGGSVEFTNKENAETIFSITIPNKAKS